MLKKSIFLVEDDHDIRELVESLLQDEGYRVFTASSGTEAMEMLPQVDDACLVLLDVMMPGMTGFEFLHTARETSAAFSRLPVVAMTASKGADLPEGVVGLIRKPFDVDHLLNVVNHHCG